MVPIYYIAFVAQTEVAERTSELPERTCNFG